MRNYPSPRNVKELQRYLELVNYYRQFIPAFAEKSGPLYLLLKKNVQWRWTETEERAARSLSEADLNKAFIIQTDASLLGLGAVLLQETEEGLSKPVAFASRTLSAAEKNYTATEIEALAIIFALRKFSPWVEMSTVVVETDHMALQWLQTLKNPVGRLARWHLEVQSYNLTIRYKKGRLNVVADALSRAVPLEVGQLPQAENLGGEATQAGVSEPVSATATLFPKVGVGNLPRGLRRRRRSGYLLAAAAARRRLTLINYYH